MLGGIFRLFRAAPAPEQPRHLGSITGIYNQCLLNRCKPGFPIDPRLGLSPALSTQRAACPMILAFQGTYSQEQVHWTSPQSGRQCGRAVRSHGAVSEGLSKGNEG